MDAPKFITGTNVVANIETNQHLGVITGGYSQDNEWWYHINDGNSVLYAKQSDIAYHFKDKEWVNASGNSTVSNIYVDPA